MTPETLQAMREQLDRMKMSGATAMEIRKQEAAIKSAERELKTKEGE